MNPYTLSLFFADGTADGLKIIEKPNWSGCGLACSKKILFEKHRKRSEFNKPGVYLLIGENDENNLRKRLYIGEGDPLMPRLEDHFCKKDWWTSVIAFTTTNQILNKAFVQYLETHLIQLAHKVQRYRIGNGNKPNIPTLSERDKAICDTFLKEILLCLPLLEINLDPSTLPIKVDDTIFFIQGKGLLARGVEVPEGFMVLANSEIATKETKTIPESIQRKRKNLLEEGTVRKDDSGKLFFKADHRFGSPSTASSVILGCSSNGREVWKSSSGESLKTIQLRRLDH